MLSPVYTSSTIHPDFNACVRFHICTIIYFGFQQLFSISSATCAAG